MNKQVPQEEWEVEFDAGCNTDNISDPPTDREWIKDFIRTHLSQAREQGRREGYAEAVEVIERYTPYAMGCTGCRTTTLEELARLDRDLKAKLESEESY